MGNITDINILLKKILEGRSSPEEMHSLFEMIKASENEIIFRETILKQLEEFNEAQIHEKDSPDFNRIYNTILNGIDKTDIQEVGKESASRKSRVKRIIINVLAIAAVSISAFFLGALFTETKNIKETQQIVADTYSEIKAPYGSNSEIILPDSSIVILNAGSTIRYRSDYNINNRDITLVGEALFKVASNLEIPLIVNAGEINVRAIGTEFNIKAYGDESIIETTLIEGKIKISQLIQTEDESQFIDLIPNQKAIYIKESESFRLEELKDLDSLNVEPVKSIYDNILISPKVDVNQVVAWTKGKLIIRGESLENMCVELQRKYNVKIIFEDEKIKTFSFTGVLLDETLEQVLNVIKLTAPINYSIIGKSVFLSSDSDQIKDFSRYLK